MSDRPGVLAGIGNTPLVRLNRLAGEGAAVWVKLEAANPTGSYKDRMALAMIEGAERDGRLVAGQTVVEYTGGSTGSSLALVCSLKGYPLRIVTSDAFAEAKLQTMQALGATLDVIPSPAGITPELIPRMQERAREISEEVGGFATDQFHNRDALDGYRQIGLEVTNQLGGELSAFCTYIGVGGCFLGTIQGLQTRWPEVWKVAVEPKESAVLSGGTPGTHRIEGGGVGFVPPLLQPENPIDEVIAVSTEEAFATARQAARVEGVWSGPSGGANINAALQLAKRRGPEQQVVTIQPDSGLKYLSGDLYRN